MTEPIPPIIVMGVQGSGKSTIGTGLAARLGIRFVDGDRLHPQENAEKMAAGIALNDAERRPWLLEVGRVLRERQSEGIVAACSALKRDYRDLLREAVPDLFVVDAEGPMELIAERIGAREHEYMPPELLSSQFEILEPLDDDERGITVDIRQTPSQIVDAIVGALVTAKLGI